MDEVVLVCDIGIKNFCFIVFVGYELVHFGLNKIVDLNELILLLSTLSGEFQFTKIWCERQFSRNVKCMMYMAAIQTFAQIKSIPCTIINPITKFHVLNDETTKHTSRARKQRSVHLGKKILLRYNLDSKLLGLLASLHKKDDFYDCLLMFHTTVDQPPGGLIIEN